MKPILPLELAVPVSDSVIPEAQLSSETVLRRIGKHGTIYIFQPVLARPMDEHRVWVTSCFYNEAWENAPSDFVSLNECIGWAYEKERTRV